MRLSILLLLFFYTALLVKAQYKKRSECIFPFKYNGKLYDDCITADAGAPWCSPNAEYKGLFYYCNDNQGDAMEKNGAFLSTQKKLVDNQRVLNTANFSIGDICTNCGANLQVVESSLSSLMKLSDDNERQINFLMDVENKNFKDFLKINFEDIKDHLHCPGGWYPLSDTECFHFGDIMMFSEVNKYCQSKGGETLSIRNAEENVLILEKASYVIPKTSAFIIGLNDEQTEGKFRWQDNSESSYLNWSENEPNNYGGNENCVMVYLSNLKWNDINCKERYYSACRGHKLYVK